MDFANNKPGARRNEQTGPDTTEHLTPDCTPRRQDIEVKSSLLAALSNRVWVLNYSLEERRQLYADRRQFIREAWVCLALAMLRLARGA